MSMDPLPVYLAARRWRDAEYLHMPRTYVEPVIWVTPEHRLDMYHPAMAISLRTPCMAWNKQRFSAMVTDLLHDAASLVERAISDAGMPGGFYAHYPDHARMGTYGVNDAG